MSVYCSEKLAGLCSRILVSELLLKTSDGTSMKEELRKFPNSAAKGGLKFAIACFLTANGFPKEKNAQWQYEIFKNACF